MFEPLSHLDYTVDVWRQIFREWEAGGAFLWALGNGMGALAAIKDESLALVLVVSDPYFAIAK